MKVVYLQSSLISGHELVAIFVSVTYLAIMCEVVVAVGCMLIDLGKNVWSMCPLT